MRLEKERLLTVTCVTYRYFLLQVRLEKERLEKLEEDIMTEVGPEDPRLETIYEKLDKMDPSTFDKRAGELLYGLGFSQVTAGGRLGNGGQGRANGDVTAMKAVSSRYTIVAAQSHHRRVTVTSPPHHRDLLGCSQAMMKRATKDMSGGWRMRVALAQALFVRPMLLVLDEPTNHLDLGACVWLEDYLAGWDSILILTVRSRYARPLRVTVTHRRYAPPLRGPLRSWLGFVIRSPPAPPLFLLRPAWLPCLTLASRTTIGQSHSADFLNGVCSKIYHLTVRKTLDLYCGNYNSYVKTRADN